MKLCSRCKKRPAVIYINKIQGEKISTEGLCMHCARALKIKPFSDYMDQMGIKDDDIEARYDDLLSCIAMRARMEGRRLRN